MRKPQPIKIERHSKPETCRVAWSAEPKPSAFTGNVKVEEKARARAEIEAAIRKDGFDPADCEIVWRMDADGWGWVARVREDA